MKRRGPDQRGYSLIELLTVLAIVSILMIAGVVYLGNRPATGVRALLDEMEGSLFDAQKLAVATGRDVTLATGGTWTATAPMVLVRGDAGIPTASWPTILAAAQGTWPPAQGVLTVPQYTSLGLAFRVATTAGGTGLTREHLHAGVPVDLAAWTLAASGNQDLTSVAPFVGTTGFSGQLTAANLMFKGAADTTLSISGTNKRFNQTFWIPVVSLSNGLPVPGGPMGVIFVQGNGGGVYKFFNPGARQGDGKWRRI